MTPEWPIQRFEDGTPKIAELLGYVKLNRMKWRNGSRSLAFTGQMGRKFITNAIHRRHLSAEEKVA